MLYHLRIFSHMPIPLCIQQCINHYMRRWDLNCGCFEWSETDVFEIPGVMPFLHVFMSHKVQSQHIFL